MVFKSWIRIKINGFNQMRLLNAFAKNGVHCFKIEKKNSSEMLLTVFKNRSEKAFAILNEMCYTYKVTGRKDATRALAVAATRAGIVFGLVVFSVALMAVYGLIWRIEISGNEKIDNLTIERTLKSAGIAVGKSRKNIDKNEVRNLINSIDGVLESSIEISGATVKIDVIETTDNVEPSKDSYVDIVSRFDGRVTRIITTSGTALVKLGDVVKKGQVIIAAYRTDAEGNNIPVPAKGEAYGETAFTLTTEFRTFMYEYERTGKTYIDTKYSIFGSKPNSLITPEFKSYETERSESYIFEGFFIPLKMYRTIYYETVLIERLFDVDERIEYYKKLLVFENIIKAGGSEIEITHHIEKIGENGYHLSVYILAQMQMTL